MQKIAEVISQVREVCQLDKTNNTLSPLQNILPESIKATSITIVQEEENNLYYIVTGEQEKQEGINTFLIKYNIKNSENTLLYSFYTP